jgi:hypothetical protein
VNAFHWIAEAYYWLLWYLGFRDGDGELSSAADREKITFMLRRMKDRMGLLWWILSIGPLLGAHTLTVLVAWWWCFPEAFLLWLFVHVLYPFHWHEVK